jgi:hypothetical protein
MVASSPGVVSDRGLILNELDIEDLTGLLDSLCRWLSHASTRTLRELADHIDPMLELCPGSRVVYAAGFIERLRRCRALFNTALPAGDEQTLGRR